MSIIVCTECGTKFDKNLLLCPNCGHVNSVAVEENKKKKKKKLFIKLAILIVVIALIFSIGKESIYYSNMEAVSYTMIEGAAKSEDAVNLIHSVWYNSIFKIQDDKTDKYTMQNGVFLSDFNDALYNLFNDEEFNKTITEINDNKADVIELMKSLKNPSKKYAEAYSVLKDYYYNYSELTNLATNPTGSLTSFVEDFNKADKETVASCEQMLLYLE